MPLYEFECEVCGEIFEVLMKRDEEFPNCPACGANEVRKIPSLFGFQDKIAYREEREKAILKRARDYLIDGKLKDARKFIQKAEEFHATDRIKRLSETLSEAKPIKEGFLIKREAIIFKKKEG